MSGYSIKTGWGDDKRIVATFPLSHLNADSGFANTKLYQAAFKQWLDEAQEICDLHNSALPSPPIGSDAETRAASAPLDDSAALINKSAV